MIIQNITPVYYRKQVYNKAFINFNGYKDTLKPATELSFEKKQVVSQANRLMRISAKNKKLANDITAQSQLVKSASEIVLLDSKKIQTTARIIKEQGILSQVPPKDGKIQVSIGNGKEKSRDILVFNAVTKELETYCTNAKMENGVLRADRRFVFENGKLDTYDESFLSVESFDTKYEKSFYRFVFVDEKLAEYCSDREAWQGQRLKLGEVFAFSDDKLHYYCKDMTFEYETGYDHAKVQIDFDENEQMKDFLDDEIQEPNGGKLFKKRFVYKNGCLIKILIEPEQTANGLIESKKVFGFINGKLVYCHLDETQKENNILYSKRLEF